MMFMEDAAKATKNKITDPIRACMLKKQTATHKLEEGKYMTDGLHVCVEGHHVGKYVFDIIKKTREKKDKETSEKVKKKLKETGAQAQGLGSSGQGGFTSAPDINKLEAHGTMVHT
jgi:hypothetical protein